MREIIREAAAAPPKLAWPCATLHAASQGCRPSRLRHSQPTQLTVSARSTGAAPPAEPANVDPHKRSICHTAPNSPPRCPAPALHRRWTRQRAARVGRRILHGTKCPDPVPPRLWAHKCMAGVGAWGRACRCRWEVQLHVQLPRQHALKERSPRQPIRRLGHGTLGRSGLQVTL